MTACESKAEWSGKPISAYCLIQRFDSTTAVDSNASVFSKKVLSIDDNQLRSHIMRKFEY